MAKCLYGALFDWIVLKVNQALLAKRHNSEHQVSEQVQNVYVNFKFHVRFYFFSAFGPGYIFC